MSKRETKKALTQMVELSLDKRLSEWVPRPFLNAIGLMSDLGLPTKIFEYIPPLRVITLSEELMGDKYSYLGAYFGERLESSPGTEHVDWKSLGWDGKPHFMMFPFIPSEWVFLHEFGHYLDDVFIRAMYHFDLPQSRLDEFTELYEQMKIEFVTIQEQARNEVASVYGLDVAMKPAWWWKFPDGLAFRIAPTAYSLATFAEWFAESFQTHCIYRETGTLINKAPKTAAFMQFFFSRKIFQKTSRKFSYIPVTELAFNKAAAQV